MENESLETWVRSVVQHTQPKSIRVCDGTEAEAEWLRRYMVERGTLIPLDPESNPRSFLYRSGSNAIEHRAEPVFISTSDRQDVGPNNFWLSPEQVNERVWPLFAGCMKGRTMFVVPYLMGPAGSHYSRVGVQLTDSPYVVATTRIMTRMGKVALDALGERADFVRSVHSVGDLSLRRRYTVHFPKDAMIWSLGPDDGGSTMVSRECHGLRIASAEGRQDGWLAEHMLIIGITNPRGVKHYVAAALPSGCGKTHLAMMVPTLPGWKVETVGDDICWMHPGEDGRLWAINPEAGMFSVAPGTNFKTNPNAMRALFHNVIFTDVALRADGTPWWEGIGGLQAGEVLQDWRGRAWTQGSETPAAHPNARFTMALSQCPSVAGSFQDPRGVPISAIVFGGRRARIAPLVYEARNWAHGVYIGATLVSDTNGAADGLRYDPMAMLGLCGYNMGDYFRHWLSFGLTLQHPPKIFHVNWYREEDGQLLWPGFGDNIRVLDWILARVQGTVDAKDTPIGRTPLPSSLNLAGLNLSPSKLAALLDVDPRAWILQAKQNENFLDRFGARLPIALRTEHQALVLRLYGASN